MSSYISSRNAPAADNTVDLTQKVLSKQEFGKRLYALMMQKGMNQSDLARASKLGRDSISTYVRGRSVPTPQNLEKLCAVLSVAPDELYPNYAANAAAIEEPVLQIKQVADDTNMMWLTVNMKVDAATAIQVMQILNNKN
ncbi:MAG: helix-turn-helix domain-containing protein [Pontibacterium sp.]